MAVLGFMENEHVRFQRGWNRRQLWELCWWQHEIDRRGQSLFRSRYCNYTIIVCCCMSMSMTQRLLYCMQKTMVCICSYDTFMIHVILSVTAHVMIMFNDIIWSVAYRALFYLACIYLSCRFARSLSVDSRTLSRVVTISWGNRRINPPITVHIVHT